VLGHEIAEDVLALAGAPSGDVVETMGTAAGDVMGHCRFLEAVVTDSTEINDVEVGVERGVRCGFVEHLHAGRVLVSGGGHDEEGPVVLGEDGQNVLLDCLVAGVAELVDDGYVLGESALLLCVVNKQTMA
jgi:hypothetical protein